MGNLDFTEKTIESNSLFKGNILHLYKDKVLLPDGNTSEREYIKHVGAVCVIPIDGNDNVILERQYRYAAGLELIEIPAGKLNFPGEDPKSAALRELAEETGAIPKEITFLGEYYGSPAILDERIYMYLATGLSFGETCKDEDEFLEVFRIPLSDAVQLVLDGKIPDGKTQAAIMRAAVMLGKLSYVNK